MHIAIAMMSHSFELAEVPRPVLLRPGNEANQRSKFRQTNYLQLATKVLDQPGRV